eukprot:CAMPEP_0172301126 /NCGR_PEP_ID=MMETSP1058-20130122/3069_1 /TAXON_ID=83371 /ORGANISM="Detonula confervacea, Strain CCMP 353" /LENGTH=1681 /DNA_ID=CAMNT_0013011137 /DNA_START=41 /DNA_END=5082 /DNA_ORIENTATION=+
MSAKSKDAPPTALAKKDETAADASQTETLPPPPPPIFIQGLSILSPRQKNSSSASTSSPAALEVALPPLRPEEPVASLRGALSEVLGFAHLTNYRLVVERLNNSNDTAANNGSGKKQQQPEIWSPFTLRNAQVTISPLLKSLEAGEALPPECRTGAEAEKAAAVAKEKEEEELVLDEYGDLSILLPLLQSTELASSESTDNGNGANAASPEKKIILNATNQIAIRVVLEKYDVASTRDHMMRVRQLLEGNAPYVTSLVGEEEELATEAEAEDGNAGEVVKVEDEKTNGTSDKSLADGDGKKDEEETEEEKLLKKEAIAASLPSFDSNYDLLFDKATKGGDLANFYYLACGEELALQKLAEEKNGGGSQKKKNGKKSKNAIDDDWLEVEANNDQEKNKKKGTNGGGGGRNKKKVKNDKSSNATNNNNGTEHNPISNITNQSTLVEVEQALYTLNETTNVSSTTKIHLSGYHPPPNHRRILGDLAYLEATMPDGTIVPITAFPSGFYVNGSTPTKFDPTPALKGNKDACYSHALLDCLLQKSKSLRAAWQASLSAAKQRSALLRRLSLREDALANLHRPAVSPFDNNASGPAAASNGMMGLLLMSASSPTTFVPKLDNMLTRPTWLVPLPSVESGEMLGAKQQTYHHDKLHSYSESRAEEELTNVFGMDVRGGGLRDWNEELQTAREMGVELYGERIERARLVHKVLCDFSEASLAGVRAIISGYILPMNPNEPARSHVYLHNNIFFSRAVDSGLDTFKIIQGDAAARKSASRDASNMGVLHRLDIPGLHTLATVLVEYMGSRIVCQSVVPGILHGEKSHSLLYGAVETLSALQCDEEMHTLLEASLGEGCMVATRKIPAHPLTEERMDVIKKYRITPLGMDGNVEEKAEEETEDDKDKMIQVCGPMEMKGILGSDKRKYVLDCTRLTPRDANWVSKSDGGTGHWEDQVQTSKSASVGKGAKKSQKKQLVPATLEDDEWVVCVLRPELVTNFAEMKIGKYLKEVAAKNNKDKKEKSKEELEESSAKDEKEDKESASKDKKEKESSSAETEAVESKKESSSSPLGKVEEEYIKSLRYNVNVFLPYTRSVESMDKDEHAKLKQDEEEAREMARHLWDTVLPNLTKEIRSSSGNGLQLPADGRSLTELIHQRGINCRYIGRLAELARKEELVDVIDFEKASSDVDNTDKAAAKKDKAPRFRMPVCWLELLECEMVARASKHVLDSYMLEQGGGTSTAQPAAQTIASFLSAAMSVGEESAAETERRTTSDSNNGNVLDQEEMNALTLFDGAGNGDADASPIRGREEIWADIEREIGRRYRYTLSLYPTTATSSKKDHGGESRAMYTPLLRRICQRSGIRLVAKHYDFGKKCVCGSSNGNLTTSYPVAPTDILDILPLVKHAASVSGETFAPASFNGNNAGGSGSSSLHVLLSDAKTMYEVGHANLNNGNFAVTLDYAQEAAAMYQRILDSPVHPQISKCLKLTAIAHYHRDEPELALAAASKYLAVAISLSGFDSAEVLNAHMTMADILLGTGRISEGVKHLRAAQFLMEFMAGPNYAGISSTYYRMGSHYYDAGKLEDALRFYELASSKRSEDRMFDCLIARNSAGVLARLGQFKPAFEYEKKAFELYVTFLGEEHDATKACSNTLIQLMKLAVEQGKRSKIQEKELMKENAADAVAEQIRADEEA